MTELLSNTGYIMYNKKLAALRGVHEAILIGELCSKYQFCLDRAMLFETDGWFYITRDEIERDTGLTAKQQRPALQHLKDDQLIDCKRMGVPSKMFYRLNIENLSDLMLQKVTTVQAERSQLGTPKGHDINMYSKKESKKESNNIYPPKSTYGEFGKVKLSDEEYEKLVNHLGTEQTRAMIDRLDVYIASKGKRYNSHYATILNWWRRDNNQQASGKSFSQIAAEMEAMN